ncbi:cytochrome b [Sphingobium yanoikuyae]|uniref:Cytochrome b n=1 Tax=Sphingobium yanoikuyae TaxID=13690 RepID=A0A430BBR9_SPHYA|nr:cytochrome b/b6 domain-containing protein [Sphingobium yanoikuyae]RSU45929.1 cytochrome b [Sphingobium yanoikuyae]
MRSVRSGARYGFVAIFLHWVMAAGIGAMAGIGLYMVHGHPEPMRLFDLYQLHKSIGVTILLAALVRLGWRLLIPPPRLPASMSSLERRLATIGHWLLYAFLLALPLTGWALVSASVYGIPTVLYGVVPWPDLPILPTLGGVDKLPCPRLAKGHVLIAPQGGPSAHHPIWREG